METDRNHWDWLAATVGVVLMLVLIVSTTAMLTARQYETDAVKRGHAYWHVNEDGTTEFKWREEVK